MSFNDFHPAVNLCFFIPVIGMAICSDHPVFLIAALICAICYDMRLSGARSLLYDLLLVGFMTAVMMLVNGFFSHNGASVLFYLNGLRITKEAFVYGAVMAAVISSVFIWFKNLSRVVTGEKFIFLFGRIFPSFALLLSMIFRYIPLLRRRYRIVREAGTAAGRGGSVARFGRELSILATWSLEKSIDTADMMEARGYGLPGRSSYHEYRFRLRDGLLLVLIAAAAAVGIVGCASGKSDARYYPVFKAGEMDIWFYATIAAFIFLMVLPLVIDAIGEIRWRLYASKR